jgi:hypothetical protein
VFNGPVYQWVSGAFQSFGKVEKLIITNLGRSTPISPDGSYSLPLASAFPQLKILHFNFSRDLAIGSRYFPPAGQVGYAQAITRMAKALATLLMARKDFGCPIHALRFNAIPPPSEEFDWILNEVQDERDPWDWGPDEFSQTAFGR